VVDDSIIDERVNQLWEAHRATKDKIVKDFILSRIASLTGGVGVIHVGGNTDLEQKELFDRVDDAVCAVRSALEEGILPGGGLALYKQGSIHDGTSSRSKSIAYAILTKALKSPLNQILSNAGAEWSPKLNDNFNQGIDVKTGQEGDMIKMGIIDPVKVTKNALQNAVSVAVTILSTNAIITMARTYEL
jgi:chaperonin GroEL